jgi:hypothetical protein
VTHLLVAAAAGALLFAAGSANAITVSGLDGNSSSFVVLAGSAAWDYSSPANDDLVADFDAGAATHDALGGSVAMGVAEASVAPDESGSRPLAAGEYAGALLAAGKPPWLQFPPAPEPKTMFLVGVALVAFSLMGSKRRQH